MSLTLIQNRYILFFIVLFLVYTGIGFSGYGNDWDTYCMINAGRNFILGGNYFSSRAPGYFIPELIIGAASLIGSFYLTNAISALLATLSLCIFWQLLRLSFSEKDSLLLTLLLAVNPIFIIAATSAIDYIYSIFFILAGIFYYIKRMPYLAAMLFALGIGSRLSNCFIVSIVCLYFLYDGYIYREKNTFKHIVISICLAVILTLLFYVPSFIAANYTLSFLTYYMADFNWIDHLGRFIYKNIYLLGVLPVLVIGYGIFSAISHRTFSLHLKGAMLVGLAVVFIQELLFFKVPLEISYLLPLLFIIYPVWFLVTKPTDFLKYMLLISTVIYSAAFNVELLDIKYNAEGTVAISAKISPSIKSGVLVKDIQNRTQSADKYWSMFQIK